MNDLGLNKNTLNLLINILKDFDYVNEVIIYGSRAKGNYNERSDIDLAIKNSSIDRHYLGRILLELNNSDIPNTVDLQIYEEIQNPDLKDHIFRVGRLIYKKDELLPN